MDSRGKVPPHDDSLDCVCLRVALLCRVCTFSWSFGDISRGSRCDPGGHGSLGVSCQERAGMEMDFGLGIRSRKKGSHSEFSLVGVCAVPAFSLRVSNEPVLPFNGQLWSACCARLWAPFPATARLTALCVFPSESIPGSRC